jgi:NAD-specific glutamate dehydrogenase
MSLRLAFMITHIEKHIQKQRNFIETRLRKKSLRSFQDYDQERKARFEAYTNYVKCNNFYMIMFLEFLKTNDMMFSNYKDQYIKELTEKSYEVIELYEKCEREKDYLEMCNIIKNDMNTAKLIYKYQK